MHIRFLSFLILNFATSAPQYHYYSPKTISPDLLSTQQKSACGWLGHCLGDPCITFNDCDLDWICSNWKCVILPIITPINILPSPTIINPTPPTPIVIKSPIITKPLVNRPVINNTIPLKPVVVVKPPVNTKPIVKAPVIIKPTAPKPVILPKPPVVIKPIATTPNPVVVVKPPAITKAPPPKPNVLPKPPVVITTPKLVVTVKPPVITPPPPNPVVVIQPPSIPCDWPGHCTGDACQTDQDCAGILRCNVVDKCASSVGAGAPVIAPTLPGALPIPPETGGDVWITFYGYDDNDDGEGNYGNAVIAYPSTFHPIATEEDGTFERPSTFAGDARYFAKYEIIYVPRFRKYYRLDDQCRPCSADANNGKIRADLFIGSNTRLQGQALISCQERLTLEPSYTENIIRNAQKGYPVNTKRLFDNGNCIL